MSRGEARGKKREQGQSCCSSDTTTHRVGRCHSGQLLLALGAHHPEPPERRAAQRRRGRAHCHRGRPCKRGRLAETHGGGGCRATMSHKRPGDIANFFQRGLPAHARDSCLRPQEEARPSSESPVAPTPVLEEVTNRMDATLRESAGGAEPGSVEKALPATGGAVPEPTVRVFSRKRPAATAAAAPPGHGCVLLSALCTLPHRPLRPGV